MTAMLDGTIDIGHLCIVVGSWQRRSVDKSATGLNGIASIDLGRGSRRICGKGVLKASSDKGIDEKIAAIEATADGLCHEMVVGKDDFSNLRIDAFEVKKKYASGANVCCEYEIEYTQLRK